MVKTYPLRHDEDGQQFGFEIDNIFVSIGTVVSLLQAVDGVSDIRRRRPFSGSSDYRIEFEYFGNPFVVLEPFGDNSRYWIVPVEPKQTPADISVIEKVFIEYQPPFLRRLLGSLLTMNLRDL